LDERVAEPSAKCAPQPIGWWGERSPSDEELLSRRGVRGRPARRLRFGSGQRPPPRPPLRMRQAQAPRRPAAHRRRMSPGGAGRLGRSRHLPGHARHGRSRSRPPAGRKAGGKRKPTPRSPAAVGLGPHMASQNRSLTRLSLLSKIAPSRTITPTQRPASAGAIRQGNGSHRGHACSGGAPRGRGHFSGGRCLRSWARRRGRPSEAEATPLASPGVVAAAVAAWSPPRHQADA